MYKHICETCKRRFYTHYGYVEHKCKGEPLYVLVRLDENTERETHEMKSTDYAKLRAWADSQNKLFDTGSVRYDVALASDLEPQAGL